LNWRIDGFGAEIAPPGRRQIHCNRISGGADYHLVGDLAAGLCGIKIRLRVQWRPVMSSIMRWRSGLTVTMLIGNSCLGWASHRSKIDGQVEQASARFARPHALSSGYASPLSTKRLHVPRPSILPCPDPILFGDALIVASYDALEFGHGG
jgi:hypothetical protein